jgi:hypothetical protein
VQIQFFALGGASWVHDGFGSENSYSKLNTVNIGNKCACPPVLCRRHAAAPREAGLDLYVVVLSHPMTTLMLFFESFFHPFYPTTRLLHV